MIESSIQCRSLEITNIQPNNDVIGMITKNRRELSCPIVVEILQKLVRQGEQSLDKRMIACQSTHKQLHMPLDRDHLHLPVYVVIDPIFD
jgi:hypothetical protein